MNTAPNQQPAPAPTSNATSSPQPENLTPSLTKDHKQTIIWVLVGVGIALFVLPTVALILFFVFMKASLGTSEQAFADFVNQTITQNQEPAVTEVNNNTANSSAFQADLAAIRSEVQQGGYTDVSPYGKCQTIKNPARYSTQLSATFCGAKLCKPSSNDCLYLLGYASNTGVRSKYQSLSLFMSQSEIDSEIATLLKSS